jgi:predicted GTPase
MSRQRIIILGAAGRDFHNFNVYFRDNDQYEVVAFTATQIPNIEDRRYPAALAGPLYPEGIPIKPESELTGLIQSLNVDAAVFGYSDVSNQYVMTMSAQVQAAGADFWLLSPKSTMLPSQKPVVSVTAVRTGAGKSQTTRKVAQILKAHGKTIAVVRHPMPYGDLAAQEVQRFGELSDLDKHDCTIEEREEYEPHIVAGNLVFAGVDYEKLLRQAESEADVVLWDGGNNDFSFFKPTLSIVVADPLRLGHETSYYPSSLNVRMADAFVINKVGTASGPDVLALRQHLFELNPNVPIVEAASPIMADDPELLTGKRVLAIEDGPTLTHGEMQYGAGTIVAQKHGAAELVDPRPYVVNSIAETFKKYPHIGKLLPAMGYGEQQIRDLEETVNNVPCDAVVVGTPIDLRRLIKFKMPATRARYELQEIGSPTLEDVLKGVL